MALILPLPKRGFAGIFFIYFIMEVWTLVWIIMETSKHYMLFWADETAWEETTGEGKVGKVHLSNGIMRYY